MSNISCLYTKHSITVNYDGVTSTVQAGTPVYDRVLAAIKEGRREEIPDIISAEQRIKRFSNSNFQLVDGEIHYTPVGGSSSEVVPQVLADKVIEFSEQGLPYEPLLNFYTRLRANPSYRAMNELYRFLESNHFPITDEGFFIAFKKIREDLFDFHSGTFHNAIGATMSVPRNTVDENCEATCSYGLHVGSHAYAHEQFHPGEGVVVEVLVDPADAVSVPTDFLSAKLRCCKYIVKGISKGEIKKAYVSASDMSEMYDEGYCSECDSYYCSCFD